MSKPQTTSKYFDSLTGIRAVAAYMVFFHHFNPLPKSNILHYFVNELHIGVTVFFVLSGFLIAYRYMDIDDFSFKNYMVNRIARIYPIYFILTTITFIVQAIQYEFKFTQLLVYGLNISMLKGFFDQFKFTGVGQGWTLTVEETFYLLAPLFFILLRRNKNYLLFIPLFFISMGIGLVLIFSKFNLFGFFSSFEFMFTYTFFGRCLEFFIGIALALFYKKQVFKKFGYFTYLGILIILLSVLLLTVVRGNFDFGIRHPLGTLINNLILPLFGIFTLFYGLLKEDTFISRILSNKVFVLLGKSSYIFYLIHMGIFADLLQTFLPYSNMYNFLGNFVIINIVSIIIYKYVEDPLNIYIRKYYGNRKRENKQIADVLKE